jgi:hypothetical protein
MFLCCDSTSQLGTCLLWLPRRDRRVTCSDVQVDIRATWTGSLQAREERNRAPLKSEAVLNT